MRIISRSAHIEFEEKRSRFIAIAAAADSREAAKGKVAAAWAEHPDATHVVYAFQLGKTGDLFGLSDDGEPHGTAGRPVLEVIKGSGITNLIVMVVRYFGGTKLGTGGLVKAYTRAAREVLAAAPTEEQVDRSAFRLLLPYHLFEQSKLLLQEYSAVIERENFSTEIELCGGIPVEFVETVRSRLRDLSSGSVSLETDTERN